MVDVLKFRACRSLWLRMLPSGLGEVAHSVTAVSSRSLHAKHWIGLACAGKEKSIRVGLLFVWLMFEAIDAGPLPLGHLPDDIWFHGKTFCGDLSGKPFQACP